MLPPLQWHDSYCHFLFDDMTGLPLPLWWCDLFVTFSVSMMQCTYCFLSFDEAICLPLPLIWWHDLASFAASSHLAMWLVCHLLLFDNVTHLLLPLVEWCDVFATSSFNDAAQWLLPLIQCNSFAASFDDATCLPLFILCDLFCCFWQESHRFEPLWDHCDSWFCPHFWPSPSPRICDHWCKEWDLLFPWIWSVFVLIRGVSKSAVVSQALHPCSHPLEHKYCMIVLWYAMFRL